MTKTTSGARSASQFETDIEIVGDVSFAGELYLRGRVNGNLVAPNDSNASLFVEQNSEVIGEIRVPLLVVSGKVSGDIFSVRRVSLKSSAEIVGNIHYTEIHVEQGATINGSLVSLRELDGK